MTLIHSIDLDHGLRTGYGARVHADSGVSFVICETHQPHRDSPYYNTQRYQDAFNAFDRLMQDIPDCRTFDNLPTDGVPDFNAHDESKFRAGRYGDFYITDCANVGGVRVGADGFYCYTPDGKLVLLESAAYGMEGEAAGSDRFLSDLVA